MAAKRKLLRAFLLFILIAMTGLTGYLILSEYGPAQPLVAEVLPGILSPVSDIPNTLAAAPTAKPQAAAPTALPETTTDFSVTFADIPSDITEGNQATFTWNVNGLARFINTTTVYFGTKSTPGALTTRARPEDTGYVQALSDFMEGEYRIPLRFIGSMRIDTPGTYFARAYALIDGKHFWSPERKFVVTAKPRYDIGVADYPREVETGHSIPITWDISGPSGTTEFTVIAGGKVSRPGPLDDQVTIPLTPYSVLVADFTTGTYTVPLRFIGNAQISEPGTYYFRALAFINGKNLWSDEFSFTVK